MASEQEKDIQVLVPYSTLVGLLEVPKRLAELENIVKHQGRQLGAIRGQQVEIMDKLRGE